MGVQIDIKRTGFPVKIGSLELFFDSSLENLRKYFEIENIVAEKLKEAEEKAMHIHFPDDVEIEDMELKTVDAALDLNKEYIAAQYDVLFGDGIFKKVYKEYPDILALEQALEPIGVAIAKRIEEQESEREKLVEDKKKEYLNKKKK